MINHLITERANRPSLDIDLYPTECAPTQHLLARPDSHTLDLIAIEFVVCDAFRW